jgi:hypothetical protein
MSVKFYLRPNKLGTAPGTQSAHVMSPNVLNSEHIIQEILQRHSTITEADVRAVLTVFYTVVSDEVAEGNTVNLPIVNLRPGITGTFESKTDRFDPTRHKGKVRASAGILVKQKVAGLKFVKANKPPRAPLPVMFKDVSSEQSGILTPGSIGIIYGEELKFNPSNPIEGIFLISQDGEEIKITHVATRTLKKLMFQIPDSLSPGKYTIEVRRAFGTINPILRSGMLRAPFEVL